MMTFHQMLNEKNYLGVFILFTARIEFEKKNS